MTKKILWFFFFVVFFVGSCCSIWLGIELINKNNETLNLYTEEEIQEKYNEYIDEIDSLKVNIDILNNKLTISIEENEEREDRITNLEDSLSEKTLRIETIESENQELLNTLSVKILEIESLQNEVELLRTNSEENELQINELTSEIAGLESEKNHLQITISNNEIEISQLGIEIQNLNLEIETLSLQIHNANIEIEDLNLQIERLQNDKINLTAEIDRLNSLLSAYEKYENQTFVVTYYVDNMLFDTQIVACGQTTSQVTTPESTLKYSFISWTTDGVNAFDFSTIISSNLRLDAILDFNVYSVNFIYNGETIQSSQVYGGEYVVAPDIEYNQGLQNFKGWSLTLNEESFVDLTTYQVTSDLTLYAIIQDNYTSIQSFDASNILNEYSVANVEDLQKLKSLVAEGNTFDGVTLYQIADIDLSSVGNWTPIGGMYSEEGRYQGNYDGLNHYIDNLTFVGQFNFNSGTGNYAHLGFFRSLGGTTIDQVSTIQNLRFRNVNYNIQKDNASSTSSGKLRYVGILASNASYVNYSNILFESGIVDIENVARANVHLMPVTNFSNVYNCINHIDFIFNNGELDSASTSNITLMAPSSSNGPGVVKNCINYGDISGFKTIFSLPVDTDVEIYNNKNFGAFTNYSKIQVGLPSYEEAV